MNDGMAKRIPKAYAVDLDTGLWIEQINRAMAGLKTIVVGQHRIPQWQVGEWMERLDQIEREIETSAETIRDRVTLKLNRSTT